MSPSHVRSAITSTTLPVLTERRGWRGSEVRGVGKGEGREGSLKKGQQADT